MLRDYQIKLVSEIYANLRLGNKRILTVSGTGSGKSVVISRIASDAARQSKRVLIVVHRFNLINQLKATINDLFRLDCNVIAGSDTKISQDNLITLAMVQSLASRAIDNNYDVVIADEAHLVCFFTGWESALNTILGKVWTLSNKTLIGFTATPWRTKSKDGFCRWFKTIVTAPSPRELIEAKFLTPARLFSYSEAFDLSNVELNNSGDFSLSSLIRQCPDTFTDDVVNQWESEFNKTKTIVFAINRQQCREITAKFNQLGYKADYVTGDLDNTHCKSVIQAFKSNEIQVLVSVGKLSEGFDSPDIETVVIARPTRSIALIMQMIGRGLRIYDGKHYFNVLDFGHCISHVMSLKIDNQEIDDIFQLNSTDLCPA
ncbi:MAG: DEAD/DEAH box helicase, partial [Waterburya sp.]